MNYHAERQNMLELCVLGSMCLSRFAMRECCGIVSPAHFENPEHRLLFEVFAELHSEGKPADAVLVSDRLMALGKWTEGREKTLEAVMEYVPSPANSGEYAAGLDDLFMARRLKSVAAQIQGGDVDLDEARKLVGEVRSTRRQSSSAELSAVCREFWSEVDLLIETGKAPPGLKTGYHDLDWRLGPMEPGSVVVIAARPSVGKSALALGITLNLAESGVPVTLFSLEMPRRNIARRLLSMKTGISTRMMRDPDVISARFAAISDGMEELYALPIRIDDRANLTIDELRAEVDRTAECGCVVVDYLQIMGGNERENENLNIAGRMKGLRAIAKERGIPVIVLSQLNRALERREEKRPQLGDLRDSGSIEAEANSVLLMFRPEYHERLANPSKFAASETEPVEVIVAKNREGETGTALLDYRSRCVRFEDMSEGRRKAYWDAVNKR